jgi:hypothetical protein
MNLKPPMLEIHKTLNNIYPFKWVFYLTKLSPEVVYKQVSRNLLKNLLVLPLIHTLEAQDTVIKQFDQQYNKNTQEDIARSLKYNEFNAKYSPGTCNALAESFNYALKNEEIIFQARGQPQNLNKADSGNENPLRTLKRKLDIAEPLEKRGKNNLTDPNYQETEAEAKRKAELMNKLNKKKEKSKLDFL